MAKLKKWIKGLITAVTATLVLTVSASASSTAGTMGGAISSVGTSLKGVIGYMSDVTSAILGDELWLLGMGFFVLLFIAGFVMYLFRVGRR